MRDILFYGALGIFFISVAISTFYYPDTKGFALDFPTFLFLISIVLGVLSYMVNGEINGIPIISRYSFYISWLGYILMMIMVLIAGFNLIVTIVAKEVMNIGIVSALVIIFIGEREQKKIQRGESDNSPNNV